MLDPAIIDEIRRREEKRRKDEESRPRVELPLPEPPVPSETPWKKDRGTVVVIEL